MSRARIEYPREYPMSTRRRVSTTPSWAIIGRNRTSRRRAGRGASGGWSGAAPPRPPHPRQSSDAVWREKQRRQRSDAGCDRNNAVREVTPPADKNNAVREVTPSADRNNTVTGSSCKGGEDRVNLNSNRLSSTNSSECRVVSPDEESLLLILFVHC